MKKTCFTLLVFTTLASSISAQLNYQWAFNPRNIDTLGGNVIGKSIKVDGSGNSYVAGYFNGTSDFDPGTGVSTLTSAGSYDIFLAKYDASGNYVYAKRIGGAGSSLGSVSGIIAYDGNGDVSSCIDNNGNIYITGAFRGIIDFDPGDSIANLSCTNSFETNIFLAKYDALGNYIYAKNIGSAGGYAISNSITLDALGNSYLTGYFVYTVDFDPGIGVANLNTTTGMLGDDDIFLAKYDPFGNYIIAKSIGGTNQEFGKSISIDGSGDVYITGNSYGTADFDPSASIANLGSGAFIAKYNSSLNYIYAKGISGPGACFPNAIAIDGNNTYITGHYNGTIDFEPSAGIVNLTSTGSQDIFVAKYSSSGNYIYAKSIGGTTSGSSNSIVVDGIGQTYITGYFKGTFDFDPGLGTVNLTSTDSAIFLAKYDASGNYVYAESMDGIGHDQGNSIAINSLGNTYITGTFNSTTDFDPSNGNSILTAGSGSLNAFIGKYDNNGDYFWAKAIGRYGNSIYNEEGKGITHDFAGNAYVTGYFSGIVDFDPSIGIANLTSVANKDIYIAKYDASGNYVFAKSIGGTGNDQSNSIAIDGSGNIFITGYFNGTVDFDTGSGIVNLTSAGSNDIFIAKYDASGNYLFANSIGGTGNDQSNTIAIDGSGNIFITGDFNNSVDFDAGSGIVNLTSAGSNDIFLAKYDALCNYIYAIKLGGTSLDRGNSLVIDANGNAFITGSFRNTVDFDPSATIANLTSAGGDDIFLAEYDAFGNYIFGKKIGGISSEQGISIALDGNKNIYITGKFLGTVDFDPGTGTTNLTSNGDIDIFISKYDSLGNYVYAKSIGGTNYDQANSIIFDGNNNIYLTGYFLNTVDFDPSSNIANLMSTGGSDIFIIQYDLNGNYMNGKGIGGTGNDFGNAIDIYGNGNVYITGSFSNTTDFDPSIGIANLKSLNGQDIFIAKYREFVSSVPIVSISMPFVNVYPNPYSTATEIVYVLNEKTNVNIGVYDITGRKVETIINSNQLAGEYRYQFSAKEKGFIAGIYFVKILFDEKETIKKIIEIK